MAVVVYISFNNSFNPFSFGLSPVRGRSGLGSRSGDGRRFRSRRGRAITITAAPGHGPDRASEEILDMLPALARAADELETDLRRWVVRLRDLGVGWDLIASALQLDEEDAKQRFHPSPRN